MKKAAIIIFTVLIFVGIAFISIAYIGGGNYTESTVKTHNATGIFHTVSVTASSADITVKLSDNGTAYAVCDETDKISYTLKTEGGVLKIEENDIRKWYDRIGIFFGTRKLVIYLPSSAYSELLIQSASGNVVCESSMPTFQSVKITASSGSIEFASDAYSSVTAATASGNIRISGTMTNNISATALSGSINISDALLANALSAGTSSGSVCLSSVTAKSFALESSSGSIKLTDTKAWGELEIKSSSGGIRLDGCDADSISVVTSSGSVKASLLTEKLFDIQSNSGSIKHPTSVSGAGKCTVKTSSGDVEIELVD